MSAEQVRVHAPSRLHFGVLDLRGHRGRRFGGMGAAVSEPGLELDARPADVLTVAGPEAARARVFAERYLEGEGLRGGAHITIRRVMPAHRGLGSGTQLALAVATALATLHRRSTDPLRLAQLVQRGARSAVGTWLFREGGFVLEGGRREAGGVAPLLVRHPMPERWHAVVAIPDAAPGLSGDEEVRAFQDLPAASEPEVERVSHLVLMQLLPALVEADLASFGEALTEVQTITGGWFSSQQGGDFAAGPTRRLIEVLRGGGAAGVGQSSWGPTVYGIVAGSDDAAALAVDAAALVGEGGRVVTVPFSNRGAQVIHDTNAGSND